MADGSAQLHEAAEVLGPLTIDRHRAIVSIMEELEAVDWYDQRTKGCSDPELAAILAHNRDEEKEHAVMTLEWLRRHDEALDQQLRTYLFTEGAVLEIEESGVAGAAEGGRNGANRGDGSLGIGSLRGSAR